MSTASSWWPGWLSTSSPVTTTTGTAEEIPDTSPVIVPHAAATLDDDDDDDTTTRDVTATLTGMSCSDSISLDDDDDIAGPVTRSMTLTRRQARRAVRMKRIESEPCGDDSPPTTILVYTFHGRGQTKDVISSLLSPLTKKLGSRIPCEVHSRDGFYPVAPDNRAAKGRSRGGFTWYKYTDPDQMPRHELVTSGTDADHMREFIASVRIASEKLNNAPVLLVGFSEGASFALDMAMHMDDGNDECPVVGVIAISPAAPHASTPLTTVVSDSIDVMITTDKKDKCVPPAHSRRWIRNFPHARVVQVDEGGHRVPQRATAQTTMLEFLECVAASALEEE